MEIMNMTTITITEKTRRELLKVAAELQTKRGEKVGYEEAIEYLLSKSTKNPQLLRRAMIGAEIPPEEFRKALREGRAEDRRHEESLERRHLD